MDCALCSKPIRGTKHRVLMREGVVMRTVSVCGRCWDRHDNITEAIMAKKKATKTGQVFPCTKCGRTDFDNDYARRGHQGKCDGSGKQPTKGKRSRKAKEKEPKPKRTRSQVGRGSKDKGDKFENVVKKILSKWYGENPNVVGTKQSLFQRSPGSGGASPTNWPLDLHVPQDFPWAVECKNREGVSHGMEAMERFLTAGTYSVVQWFMEAEEQLATAAIQKPLLLVFTRNQYPIFAALRRPVTAKGENLMFPVRHMTLCGDPFMEIVVARLDEVFEATTSEWWLGVYAQTAPGSYMPRKWK